MRIKDRIAESPIALYVKILRDQSARIWQFARNNARSGNSKSKNKAVTDIMMLTHALEKAFSLPNVRKSFGVEKARMLLNKINRFIEKYGWDQSLVVPVCLLRQYVDYHKADATTANSVSDIDTCSLELSQKHLSGVDPSEYAGAVAVCKDELISNCRGNFEMLVANRYAVRNFSGKHVPDEILLKALDIARKSPSACNRQAYRVHVFRGKDKNGILTLQGGARGFYESADAVLLISADANRYYTREAQLGYVDSSLFAMTLMYALSYLGIGSIPLTLEIEPTLIARIKHDFSIPENEIPVLLIAVGDYPDEFKVAESFRNPVESFVRFH